jgi:hypothetical protein
MSVTKTYNFENETGLVFDSDLIEILNGIRLKLQNNPGQDFTEDFEDETGLVFDSDLIEVLNGQVQQKNKRPSNAIFYSSYNSDINGNWGDGVLTGLAVGGASVSDGKLDLTHNDIRYVNYDANGNADSQQTGCIRFRLITNYSGNPGSVQSFVVVSKSDGDATNAIKIFQSSTLLFVTVNNNVGSAIISNAEIWSPVIDTEYEIELNWDITTGETRLFVDGVQLGSTLTDTGIRSSDIGLLRVGADTGGSNSSNFSINDLIYFDSVQHTTNYTPDWSDIYEYEYLESEVILPEMEYTGAGTLITFDSFITTEGGSPRYSLQIGRSGNYLYWNGSAWVTSDGTYSQANDKATFNANLASLNIEGEIYGQFKIHFTNTAVQSSVAELTASLTAQIYPLTNPSVYISDATSLEELMGFLLTIVKTGSDEVKIILYKGSVPYYYDGADWSVSDETYSQSNTLTEIQTNKATFTTVQINMYVRLFIHSETGLTSPEAGPLQIVYNFAGVIDTIHKTIVYGYQVDADGNADETPIIAYLSIDLAEYKNVTQITGDEISTTPRSDGYWEIELVETDNMEGTVFYNFRLKDKIFQKYVSEVDYISFNSLVDV